MRRFWLVCRYRFDFGPCSVLRGSVILWLCLSGYLVRAAESPTPLDEGLFDMSLSDLMRQRPELHQSFDTASIAAESVRDAPGSMSVYNAATLERRGYDSLEDLLGSLPGFDTITTNGTMHTVAYQRGYRTPWTQRTLFLINGKTDNNLWNHSAQLSRQYPMVLIDRVEVLQGPAGAVYGPNAFLGVINVITRDSSNLMDGQHRAEARLLAGSFGSKGIDIGVGGKEGVFSYDVGLKLYSSDEPSLDDYSEWGYTDPALLSDPQIWGSGIGEGIDPAAGNPSPVGDLDVDGVVEPEERFSGDRLGVYHDPTDNYGFIGEARLGNWELGVIKWETREGYGPYYSFADSQPGAIWEHESTQLYLNHEQEIGDSVDLHSEIVLRSSRVGGDWVESFGDEVSISAWNAYNEAWRFGQDLSIRMSNDFQLNTGWKFEHRDLSKLYAICNYWLEDTCYIESNAGPISSDSISSDNPLFPPPNLDENFVSDDNLKHATDYGAYVQGVWDYGDIRLNAGLRWDENSDFGPVWNPRMALIVNSNARTIQDYLWRSLPGTIAERPIWRMEWAA